MDALDVPCLVGIFRVFLTLCNQYVEITFRTFLSTHAADHTLAHASFGSLARTHTNTIGLLMHIKNSLSLLWFN